MSQKVEKSLSQASGAYEGTDEHRSVLALKVLREEGFSSMDGDETFRERLNEILTSLKASYREMVTV